MINNIFFLNDIILYILFLYIYNIITNSMIKSIKLLIKILNKTKWLLFLIR